MWAVAHGAAASEGLPPGDKSTRVLKNMLLSSMLFYKTKFKECGDLVVCCDSDRYWRRDYFPYYKGNRKELREKSKVDSGFIADFIFQFKIDLKEYFKFKVIQVDGAEADDVIGSLAKFSCTNELTETIMGDEPSPVVIVSEDGDFTSFTRYSHITQHGPRKKAEIKLKVPLNEFLIEHIVRGDSVDAIPNILSPDNSIVDKIKQKSITKEYLEKFFRLGEAACETETEKRNWIRNKTLVSFDSIPTEIEQKIIEAYIGYEIKGTKKSVLNYLIKNRCSPRLIESLERF